MRENYVNKEWVVSEGDDYLYTHSVEHRDDMWKAAELQYKEEQALLAKEKLEKMKPRKRKRKQLSDSSSSKSEYEGDTDISSSETSVPPDTTESETTSLATDASECAEAVEENTADSDEDTDVIFLGLEQHAPPVIPPLVPFLVKQEPEEDPQFLLQDSLAYVPTCESSDEETILDEDKEIDIEIMD